TVRSYDQSQAQLRSGEAQLDQAHADLKLAQDQLDYTELRADADGIITARAAEAGQVVAQAQLGYTLAPDRPRHAPRDAAVTAHEGGLKNGPSPNGRTISLLADPTVKPLGDPRETSPAVDPATETVLVKVGLRETPHAMTLGALINGTGSIRQQKVVLVPWAS